MAIMLLAWAVFAAVSVDISAPDLIEAAAFALGSALTLRVVPAVVRRTLTPLPRDIDEAAARRLSLGRFIPAVGLGAASASIIAYLALIEGFIAHSPVTYVVPFVIGEVVLYRHVLPRPVTVTAARRRLEAVGATSFLWEELTGRRNNSGPTSLTG